jgi:amino acid adenylation domain-containing protein
VADPALRLSGLPLVTPEERAELLARGAGAAPVAPPEPLVRTFERCAAARPDAVALSCDTRAWTYRELVRRAGRLARRLRRLGVGPESLVGVCARRSPEAVAGMLAVLEAGGAYLPLDPEHPPERLAFILRDAGARVVLAPAELRHLVPDDRTAVALDDPGGDLGEDARDAPAPPTGPRHLAYVIYTSGSTGEPKGVLVEQEGVANLCAWIPRAFGLGPDDVFLWTGSPAFDVSVLELWPALLAGARVEVLEDALVDPERLRDHVVERGVTLAALVAGTTEGLLRRSWPRSCRFRLIISGGERLRRRPSPETPFELVNSYGPTELTVISTTGAVERHGAGLPHVGLPLPGHRAAVVDGRGELVPEDVVGELCVGGVGVARGYAGRPRHTAECFVPDPDGPPGSRRYRTGDLVRWRRGRLCFVGRIDEQVKVRGFRVELGEVEAVLRSRPEVLEAAVQPVAAADGRDRLVAYVVPAPGAGFDPEGLERALGERLPPYMVPSTIVRLDAMPLAPTGKLDRKKLPALAAPRRAAERIAPRDELEAAVARVWAQVLELEEVGVRDNFFDLGGHSLLAAQVTARLRRALDVDLKVRALFDHPTVEGLVRSAVAPGLAVDGRRKR